MDIDTYFDNVGRLAILANGENVAIHDLIESPGRYSSIVDPSVQFRETLLSGEEENDLSGYLAIGFFAGRSRRSRLASFAMTFDVQHEATRLRLRAQCEPYSRTQPLFRNVPSLFERIRRKKSGNQDYELIDLAAGRSVSGSEVYQVGSGFTKLCPFLSPGIVNWVQKEWPSARKYVRFDADAYFNTKPLQLLTEATLVPANPRWLPDFSLHKGMKEFAAYQLQDRPLSEGHGEYWDYHIKHLRRLEIHVQRREDNYLSMLIEELPRADDPNGLMVGRCIHLDTRDPALTPLREVTMQHLDLAINVYAGEDRQKRFGQSLQHGKVQDATLRTHLLRIEETPFVSLFAFCEMFLQSKILLSEWLNELVAS
ncbi:hypothetical protein ACD589_00445 [Rhizobium sp. 814_E9_N1_1]|uniref:hypothetical protein n=1 Tax=unclassified Rhizobium TaxID=2613769 RepID=UPI003F28EAD7